ncbi:MAG: hypothetical protein ACO1OB_29690 [Archangium sp.]
MNTLSFYGPAPEASRSEDVLTEYRKFLEKRNGPGFAARDARMANEFNPALVTASTPVDSARFNRNYEKFREKNVSEDELALLTFVKINAGEAYGVEVVGRARKALQNAPGVAAEVERTLTAEETYHTRLLVGAAGHYEGLDVTGAWRPALPLRVLIGSLARLPKTLFHPLLLASEIAGVHVFDWMLRRLRTLFPNEPRVRESMEQRLTEVLIDEIGHVTFNRVMTGALGRAVSRPLAGLVSLSNQNLNRELVALGYGKAELGRIETFDFGDLPEEVRRRAFFA